MLKDSRTRNQYPQARTATGFLSEYAASVQGALASVSGEALERALRTLEDARRSARTVFVGGNGGSAAISEHLCCDWGKGTHSPGKLPQIVHSLSSNMALFSAISNDMGFDRSFSYQLELQAKRGDVLVLISSSGGSPNVIEACRKARELGVFVIGLTGFDGGSLRRECDLSLHVEASNYGVIEDAHQSLMHIFAQLLWLRQEGRT